MGVKIPGEVVLIGGIGLGVVALGWLAARTAAGALREHGDKVNPYSADNVIYDNVIGGAGRAISGDEHWSLGGWLYDITHPNEPDPTAPVGESIGDTWARYMESLK